MEVEGVSFWEVLQELERREAEPLEDLKSACQASTAIYVAAFNIVGLACTDLASKQLEQDNEDADLAEIARLLGVASQCTKMADSIEAKYTGPKLNLEIVHDLFRDGLNLDCPDVLPQSGQPSKPAGGKRPDAQA